MITGTRTITLQDITKPVIMSSPLDLIVECGVDNTDEIDDWVMDNGGATAIDECDAPTITFVAQGAEATCGSTTITPYLLTVTDACGNFVTRTANFDISGYPRSNIDFTYWCKYG